MLLGSHLKVSEGYGNAYEAAIETAISYGLNTMKRLLARFRRCSMRLFQTFLYISVYYGCFMNVFCPFLEMYEYYCRVFCRFMKAFQCFLLIYGSIMVDTWQPSAAFWKCNGRYMKAFLYISWHFYGFHSSFRELTQKIAWWLYGDFMAVSGSFCGLLGDFQKC